MSSIPREALNTRAWKPGVIVVESSTLNALARALAQKGLRTQAETAFRKAVEIDPDYGDAHKNLAIIYLSATPPLVELARWHYEKALASGVPPNPDLEKMLNAGNSGAPQ